MIQIYVGRFLLFVPLSNSFAISAVVYIVSIVGLVWLGWIVVAIRCGPLLSQVVNSTAKHVGAVLSVSCRVTDTWDNHQSASTIVAECDHQGRWQPTIPACVRKYTHVQDVPDWASK